MKIKAFIAKSAQLVMIIAVIHAGSFVLMEETSEKTERAESEQEAIYSQFNSSRSTKLSGREKPPKKEGSPSQIVRHKQEQEFAKKDYNVNFIYTTSYLDTSPLV